MEVTGDGKGEAELLVKWKGGGGYRFVSYLEATHGKVASVHLKRRG